MRKLLAFVLLALSAATASADPACGLYQYRAEITRVIDGDTVVADIDLGFHTWRRDEHLRLWGINAPSWTAYPDRSAQRRRSPLNKSSASI